METLVEPEPEEKPVGYWGQKNPDGTRVHVYHRLNVEQYVEEFVGWQALRELIEHIPLQKVGEDAKGDIYVPKYRTLFALLFLSGGRISEVLSMKKSNFEILDTQIKVSRVRLLKRYRKLDRYVDPSTGKNRWHTEPKIMYRKTFTIQRGEPYAKLIEDWLRLIPSPDAYLFPSPRKHHNRFLKNHLPLNVKGKRKIIDLKTEYKKDLQDVNGDVPMSRIWIYSLIRQVNDNLPKGLRERLGLNRPFTVVEPNNEGRPHEKTLSKEIHLWLHWFRSQRASQLRHDYNLATEDLVEFFTWEDLKTAMRYSKMGWKGIDDKIKAAKATYQ